jgi:hypothetical protein
VSGTHLAAERRKKHIEFGVKPGPAAKTAASRAKGLFLLCLKKAQVLKWPAAGACGRRVCGRLRVSAAATAWDAGTLLSAEPMARAAADSRSGLFRERPR